MIDKMRRAGVFGAVGTALLALASPANAEDITWSANIGITSDYVFRGVSQNSEDATIQGGLDLGYNIFYAGVWASRLNFGTNSLDNDVATTEVDLYAGVKPVWGKVTFDFGVIYYAYPDAKTNFDDEVNEVSGALELDYVELKAGYSASFIQNLTTSTVVYYSPEYTGEQGPVWTVESNYAYTLPQIGVAIPTLSALIGASYGNTDDGFIAANGEDKYYYWNAGITFAVEKFAFDFRYHDTDISNTDDFCTGTIFQCDQRFVFTAKLTLP